jgi:hypothetical protein
MARGCLQFALSLLFFGAELTGIILYIWLGPHDALLGILFGTAYVWGTYLLAVRVPWFLMVTRFSSREERAVTGLVTMILSASPDPRTSASVFAQVIGSLFALVFAAATLLFAFFTAGLLYEGERSSGLTAASVLVGVCGNLTYMIWKFVVRGNSLK